MLARFDRRERGTPVPVTVYGPDDQPRSESIASPEDPGPLCFPPVAASITAGARLMLALLERLVGDAGGSYVFCDTDSMAIVATPKGGQVRCATGSGAGEVRALSWPELKRILRRFDSLNPYDRKLVRSAWKVEQQSMTTLLYCYAISAKRYCLYRPKQEGKPEVVGTIDSPDEHGDEQLGDMVDALADWSEHGLGLYLDPTSKDTDRPRRDAQGRRLWVAEAWQWILADARGASPKLPAWADTYALTRFTVSGPKLERWFAGYNQQRDRGDWIRPGSFGLIAHPIAIGHTDGARPAAPYENDPARWTELDWNRRGGRPGR